MMLCLICAALMACADAERKVTRTDEEMAHPLQTSSDEEVALSVSEEEAAHSWQQSSAEEVAHSVSAEEAAHSWRQSSAEEVAFSVSEEEVGNSSEQFSAEEVAFSVSEGGAGHSSKQSSAEEVAFSVQSSTQVSTKTCKPVNTNIFDWGYEDAYRGFYDVQGCGQCKDYCRWTGYAKSGGDPNKSLWYNPTNAPTEDKKFSYWSCAMAGTTNRYTYNYQDPNAKWTYQKCGVNKCKPVNTNISDVGYPDAYRGWYDVQGCGRCNDYCRWVGYLGSGGDPKQRMEVNPGNRPYSDHQFSIWSCALAGTSVRYTWSGHFQHWSFRKCSGQGASLCNMGDPAGIDKGFDYDPYRGWYDVQGCGRCYYYCRWLGGTKRGGSPWYNTTSSTGGKWSCTLGGSLGWRDELDSWDNNEFKLVQCTERGNIVGTR